MSDKIFGIIPIEAQLKMAEMTSNMLASNISKLEEETKQLRADKKELEKDNKNLIEFLKIIHNCEKHYSNYCKTFRSCVTCQASLEYEPLREHLKQEILEEK